MKNLLKLVNLIVESTLNETPIDDFKTIGNFSKRSSIKHPVDRALLSSPKAQAKIKRIWQNTPYTFNIAIVNDPRVNKSEFIEIGVVDEQFVRDRMKLTSEELPIDPSAITIIFTNNRGDERYMASAWILAHRFGHAIAASERFRNSDPKLSQEWRTFVHSLTNLFVDILRDVYDIDFLNKVDRKDVFRLDRPQELVLKLAAQQLGTMKSARDANLRNWYEFAYELFSQYLLTGSVKLNKLPDKIITKLEPFGRKRYRGNSSKELANMYNNHDLEYYSSELEMLIDNVLNQCKGKIFVM